MKAWFYGKLRLIWEIALASIKVIVALYVFDIISVWQFGKLTDDAEMAKYLAIFALIRIFMLERKQ